METVIAASIAIVFILSLVLIKSTISKNANSNSTARFNEKSKEFDVRQKFHHLNKMSAQIRI